MSGPPYPPPSAGTAAAWVGRSTIDCLIDMARRCAPCCKRALHTCHAHVPCTRAMHTCHAPHPRVPSLALTQLKPANRASRRRPLAQAQAATTRLAQATAAHPSCAARFAQAAAALAQAAAARLAQAAAPPLAQAAALLARAAAARSSRRRSACSSCQRPLKPPLARRC